MTDQSTEQPSRRRLLSLAALLGSAGLLSSQTAAADMAPQNFSEVSDTVAHSRLTQTGSQSGELILVKGYHQMGDGGGGIFCWDASSTALIDGGVTFAPLGTSVGRWLRLDSGTVRLSWFGAQVDQDASEPLTRALAHHDVVDLENRHYVIGNVQCTSEVGLRNGKLTIRSNAWYGIECHDSVELHGITFDRQYNKTVRCLQNGRLNQAGQTINQFVMRDCTVTGDANMDAFRLYQVPRLLQIADCCFVSNGFSQQASVFHLIFGTASHSNLHFSWQNNLVQGYDTLVWQDSTGYFDQTAVHNNKFIECGRSLVLYHLRSVSMIGNQFSDCRDECYLWQDAVVKGNTWIRCGLPASSQQKSGAVKIESWQGIFAENRILEATHNGLHIQGGNSPGLIESNYIYNSGASGIWISTHQYGGQIIGLVMRNNKLYGNQQHGVFIDRCIVQEITIQGNNLHGNGRQTNGQYAGIYIDVSNAYLRMANISSNSIQGNDFMYGIQDSHLQYGIWINDQQASQHTSYHCTYNQINAPIAIHSSRSYGRKLFAYNIVPTLATVVIPSLGIVTQQFNLESAGN